MPPVISLAAVAEELGMLSDEFHGFLNRKTGEIYGATSELVAKAEEDDDEELLGWEVELVEKLREILGSEDWLKLPERKGFEDYRIMERFCLECCEGRVQEDLLGAIRGRGAFGRFKAGTIHWGARDAWHKFQDQVMAEEAAEWLQAQGLEYGP